MQTRWMMGLGHVALMLAGSASATGLVVAQDAAGWHVARRIVVGGEGGWDYPLYDGTAHRLFLSHGTQVDVVDAESGAVIGHVRDTPGVHGIAIAPELGKGFVSGGRDSSVTVFDLTTLAPLARLAVPGRNPDAILYEPVTRRVFTFNGGSAGTTAFDATSGALAGSLALGGKPEFAVADGRGGVFVNIEDRAELVHFDARRLAETARWKIPDCEDPSGLAADLAHERLFAVCGNGHMVVLDAADGHAVATLPIGAGVDGVAFDPGSGLAFATAGEGRVTVVRERDPAHFEVVADVPTERGARTVTLDPVAHRVYTVTAQFEAAPAPAPGQPRQRPRPVPGTFMVLVLEGP